MMLNNDQRFKLVAEDGRELDISAINIDKDTSTLFVVNIEGMNDSESIVNAYLDGLDKCIRSLGVKNYAIIPCVGHCGEISVVRIK